MDRATELEFLKYVYENLPVEDLWEIEEGFRQDIGKQLPEGYTSVEPDIEEGFWDEEK